MPLVTPPAPVGTTPTEPIRIAEPHYKGNTIDTRYTPSTNIVAYVEGSRWSVDYFSQVIGSSQAQTGQNLGLSGTTQQYKLIERLVLKVSSALTSSQDETTKEFSTNGTAMVLPGLIPTEGDMFVAQIGDGRFGLFEVTSSERKSIYHDAVHEIQYTMVNYLTPERKSDLLAKVIVNYVFVHDNLKYNQSPLIEKKVYNVIEQLEGRYKNLVTTYFKEFFNHQYMTIALPGQSIPTYDHFLTKAVDMICRSEDAIEVRSLRVLNVSEDGAMRSMNFWDALIEADYGILSSAMQQSAVIDVAPFRSHSFMRSVYYTGFRALVYPTSYVSPSGWADSLLNKDGLASMELQPVDPIGDLPPNIPEAVLEIIDDPSTPADDNLTVDIYPVTADSYYVFREAFYKYTGDNDGIKLSKLELLTYQMMKGEPIDPIVLLHLIESRFRWGALERAYYMPILMILSRYCARMI